METEREEVVGHVFFYKWAWVGKCNQCGFYVVASWPENAYEHLARHIVVAHNTFNYKIVVIET